LLVVRKFQGRLPVTTAEVAVRVSTLGVLGVECTRERGRQEPEVPRGRVERLAPEAEQAAERAARDQPRDRQRLAAELDRDLHAGRVERVDRVVKNAAPHKLILYFAC
jgi:hypothetical protein